MVDEEISRYVEAKIIPLYDSFDKGHDRSHVRTVIEQSMKLASNYDVDTDMVYVIAAFHDLGLCEGRELHHIVSGRILLEDSFLRSRFSESQLEIMRDAVEDHRASSKHAPRTIYGMIVAEADRQIDIETILRRTVQYGMKNYPSYSRDEHYARFLSHLKDKYAESGYLRLWIPESDNARRLAELRRVIGDESLLKNMFDRIFDEESRS